MYLHECVYCCVCTNGFYAYLSECACVFSLCMCVDVKAYIHECVCWMRIMKLSVHWPLQGAGVFSQTVVPKSLPEGF